MSSEGRWPPQACAVQGRAPYAMPRSGPNAGSSLPATDLPATNTARSPLVAAAVHL
eukprot:CAMPEP_0115671812 /NCGR_PEP_ID=MMETSP0272-20121206/52249_1 /TAXON_ID=71861 /ORGANISM="Scrippsiella trochoidea, Strain CCMP3099" /LENGTH=55 /DNA_ID=CAMNT_0003110603 /DNA_START=73 /DNA_END=236 /DNA_ORIENTATION=+